MPGLNLNKKIKSKSYAANSRKDVKIKLPLKYLSNFKRTLEVPLINCEINLVLTWSDKWVLSNDTKGATFAKTDAKIYVPFCNFINSR